MYFPKVYQELLDPVIDIECEIFVARPGQRLN